jgi:hypothetical protein
LQDSLLGNFDRWHETAVVRFFATSSAALLRKQGVLCVARAGRVDNRASMEYQKSSADGSELRFARKLFPAVMVLQAVLGFFDSVTSRIVIPSRARNLLCQAASKSEIPRYARNDKF